MNTVTEIMTFADSAPHLIECRENITSKHVSGELNGYEFYCAMMEFAVVAKNCMKLEMPEEFNKMPYVYPRDIAEIATTYINLYATENNKEKG